MFPFWLDLSSDLIEPLAVCAVAVITWLFQVLGPRGC